jgi:hypothetical protein
VVAKAIVIEISESAKKTALLLAGVQDVQLLTI